MLTSASHSMNHEMNITFVDFFPGRNVNLMLLTHNQTESRFLRKINKHISGSIISLDYTDFSEEEFEKKIKNFFVELNWQLYAMFRKNPETEFGTSLCLTVTFSDKIYFVQFGRMLCGITSEDGFLSIGNAAENFSVKSMEGLKLLGNKDKNIQVKVHSCEVYRSRKFIVFPAEKVQEITKMNFCDLLKDVENLYSGNPFPYCIISGDKQVDTKKSRRKK